MPVYIALTNLSDEGRDIVRKNPKSIKANNKALEAMGVKVLAQYATLGPYDFVNIFVAENDDKIFKAAVQLTGRGVANVQTLVAKHIDDFIAVTEK